MYVCEGGGGVVIGTVNPVFNLHKSNINIFAMGKSKPYMPC